MVFVEGFHIVQMALVYSWFVCLFGCLDIKSPLKIVCKTGGVTLGPLIALDTLVVGDPIPWMDMILKH